MTSPTSRHELSPSRLHWYLTLVTRITLGVFCALLIASCSEETVRTESEYLNLAEEHHAKGDSKRALFELAAGMRHYPESAEIQIMRGHIFLDLEDGSAAEIAYNKAVALGYNKNFIKHKLAESWLYQRNPSKVIITLEPEITEGSRDPLIHEVVGRAYIALRNRSNPKSFIANMKKAESYIDTAYKISPRNTRVLISKAWISALAGNIDEALEWLDTAHAIVPDQRENLEIKGELLVRQGNIDAAHDIYVKLIKKFPQHPQYKLELGHVYFLKQDYEEARNWIAPIVNQYPQHLRANTLLANTALMQKKYDEAKTLSATVLTTTPNDLQAMIINGASSYFLDDLENAHQKLRHFHSQTGSLPALKLLVATKLKLGENEQAADLLRAAGETDLNAAQTDTELLNLVAIASAKVGQIDTALAAYKKLAAEKPEEISHRKNLAFLQISQGNYTEGFKNLEDALAADSDGKDPGQALYTLATSALQVKQYDRALDYVAQYKEAAPDSHKPWVISAVLQTSLKNYPAAQQDFEQAMTRGPDVAEVRTRYAIFEQIQGNRDKAVDLAQQALKLDPSDIGAGKLVLAHFIQDNKFDVVADMVEKALKNKKASPYSRIFFADYYTLLGRPRDTLAVLNSLPATLRSTGLYQITSAKAYLRNDEAARAVDILENIVQADPKNTGVLKYLLRGYLLTQDQRKYQDTLEKLGRLSPNDFANQYELAKLYISTGQYSDANDTLRAMSPASDAQAMEKKLLAATLEINRGDHAAAQSILTPLHDQYPGNGAVSMLYARSLANAAQDAKAIEVAESWKQLNPENLDVTLFLADIYLRNQDNARAGALYHKILAADNVQNNVVIHVHNNLANVYLNVNQADEAMTHAQKAFDLAPNNPNIIDTYAQVLLKQGQAQKAVRHFDQAIALLPGNDRKARSLFTLGKARALLAAGDKEAAQKILNRLVKEDPAFPRMDEVRQLLSGI